MIIVRSITAAIVLATGLAFAAPLLAQTSATLNVSVRVIPECTVSLRGRSELARLASELGDPDLIRRCSKGVVSRVDRRVVKVAKLRSRTIQARGVSGKRVVRTTVDGRADVVLVTVTY